MEPFISQNSGLPDASRVRGSWCPHLAPRTNSSGGELKSSTPLRPFPRLTLCTVSVCTEEELQNLCGILCTDIRSPDTEASVFHLSSQGIRPFVLSLKRN